MIVFGKDLVKQGWFRFRFRFGFRFFFKQEIIPVFTLGTRFHGTVGFLLLRCFRCGGNDIFHYFGKLLFFFPSGTEAFDVLGTLGFGLAAHFAGQDHRRKGVGRWFPEGFARAAIEIIDQPGRVLIQICGPITFRGQRCGCTSSSTTTTVICAIHQARCGVCSWLLVLLLVCELRSNRGSSFGTKHGTTAS